jgi:hypothetical protein
MIGMEPPSDIVSENNVSPNIDKIKNEFAAHFGIVFPAPLLSFQPLLVISTSSCHFEQREKSLRSLPEFGLSKHEGLGTRISQSLRFFEMTQEKSRRS